MGDVLAIISVLLGASLVVHLHLLLALIRRRIEREEKQMAEVEDGHLEGAVLDFIYQQEEAGGLRSDIRTI